MRQLAPEEKRTIRLGIYALVIGLALAGLIRGGKFFSAQHDDYQRILKEADTLKLQLKPFEDKALMSEAMMESFHLDPARLSRTTLVAQASAAIQKAATAGGVQLGPVRETASRNSAKELTTIQLEGTGAIAGVMGLLHRLDSLGFPLIVDSIQITADSKRPGPVKVNLTIILMDFDQWKSQEVPHA